MIELGRQFGLYVIKEMISDSDSYVCCKAEDPFFNREVALKVYSTELFAGEENLPGVENLLERLAVLDHPSIAPIFDSGIEGEYYYYTTSCYFGGSLATQCTETLPSGQQLTLLVELVQALEYAFEQQLEAGELCAEKIFFDSEGRAVISDFGIDRGIKQILATGEQAETAGDKTDAGGSVAETLRSVGQLLLRLSLGPKIDLNQPIAERVARVADQQLEKLLGRLLLPSEMRFASYTELLETLAEFDQLAPLLKKQSELSEDFEDYTNSLANGAELPSDKQVEQAVAEVRQLVAEKNGLQQNLDKAVYARNVAENKFAERLRALTTAEDAVAKAQEEANVAWELVAGQKHERWRPVAWTVGGFIVGFLLSGSYGYYYSEQTRNELLAKLHANEELIKTATWQAAKQQATAPAKVTAVKADPLPPAAIEPVTAAQLDAGQPRSQAIITDPIKEIAQQWWPVGNEFSSSAAIPIEQIKAALGLQSVTADEDLPDLLRQEVLAVVGGWATSWSSQDLGQYFSFYSDDYRPELGRSQDEWRDLRSKRLTTPEFIELSLDDIRVKKIDENRIQVKLKQSYRSDYYQDRILKSINLIKENGTWRIFMERSLGMLNDIVGG